MAEPPAYCLHCFAELPASAEVCPYCGAGLAEQHRKRYAERLIHALSHPLADVRMRAIIALGLRGEAEAAEALVGCALRHPIDVVEGLEIVGSLRLIAETTGQWQALTRIAEEHPARGVRQAALGALKDLESSTLRGHGG